MDINTVIDGLSSTPFLFIGSGLSRRYYNLPDWKGLLEVFAKRLSQDEFAFQKYIRRAENMEPNLNSSILADVASLIMDDFDRRWFDDISFRNVNEKYKTYIKEGHSPFKVELAQYIVNNSNKVEKMKEEISMLKKISSQSIAGIITTNYDQLLEVETDQYRTYVGQEQLVFSSLQGWGEVYKIHGSVTHPDSLTITRKDYQNFKDYCPYLTAKLMTIFMEYPIIFLGYSINDSNIKLIFNEMSKCLTSDMFEKLQNRFIYVEYDPAIKDFEFFKHTLSVDNGNIVMTGIKTDNFLGLYKAIMNKRATLPVKVLRMFKEQFYEFAVSNDPDKKISVTYYDDQKAKETDLIWGVGRDENIEIHKLATISSDAWYRHVVLEDLKYSADNILSVAYPWLATNNQQLPVYLLLTKATQVHTHCLAKAPRTYDDCLSKTIINTRKKKQFKERSINWIKENFERDKSIREIPYLYAHEIDVRDLYEQLKDIFLSGYYGQLKGPDKSGVHRLVRIYDFLMYGRDFISKNT